MHARIAEVLGFLDKQREALERTLKSVPEARRARRPGPDRWSVAEVLEHLTIVERRIASLVQDAVTRARDAGLGKERDGSPVVPTVPVAQLLDRSSKITARENALPTGAVSASDAWTDLT